VQENEEAEIEESKEQQNNALAGFVTKVPEADA